MARSGFALAALALLGLFCTAQAQASFPNFYAALAATGDAKLSKQIVDRLNLKSTLSNPQLRLTIFTPRDSAFEALARRLRTTTAALSANRGLMQQVLYYHFATGVAGGAKSPLFTSSLKPGARLTTMLTNPQTKQAYTLGIASSASSPVKLAVQAAGSTANIIRPNQRCGAGVAHGLDNVLLPVKI